MMGSFASPRWGCSWSGDRSCLVCARRRAEDGLGLFKIQVDTVIFGFCEVPIAVAYINKGA